MSTAIAGRPKPTASVRAAIFGPTPRKAVRPSMRVGDDAAVLLDDPAREGEDVAGLGLGEGRRAEQARPAPPRPARPSAAGVRAAAKRRRQTASVVSSRVLAEIKAPTSCSNGRAEAPVAQVEHRRLGQPGDGHAEPTERLVDVERFLDRDRRGAVSVGRGIRGANRGPTVTMGRPFPRPSPRPPVNPHACRPPILLLAAGSALADEACPRGWPPGRWKSASRLPGRSTRRPSLEG